MRADNTRHIITAAHQRHELTRAKASRPCGPSTPGRPGHLPDRRPSGGGLPVLALRPTRHPGRDRTPPRCPPSGAGDTGPGSPAILGRLPAAQARGRHTTDPAAGRGEPQAPRATRPSPRRTTRHGEPRYGVSPRRPPTSQSGNDRPQLKGPAMHPPDASRTTSTMQHRRSQLRIGRRLKIIQAQVGHESDSSTAVYTHVSDDFMNTALRRALASALDTDHESRPGHKERR